MPVRGERLQTVLEGYSNFLQKKDLAVPKHRPYLVGWVREFLLFAQGHGGYTFEQTLLALSGVNPRTAMELMRHSDIRLTTNIYQHLELVDTAGAVNLLPMPKAESEQRVTGTYATKG